jgi:adenylylsulfate kinase
VSWAIWITGLPGSGKSAIARAAATEIAAHGEPVQVLELDALRRRLTPLPSYDAAEREAVYRALVVIATVLTRAGIPVIIDATAHRRAWRDLARASIAAFAEVQLHCPLDVARQRERTRGAGAHPAAIYARAGRPGATVPGIDVPYEPALDPELSIDTTEDTTATAAARVAGLARTLARRHPAPSTGADGFTVWVSGRPGSGKTTVVSGVSERLHGRGMPVAVLEAAEFVGTIAGDRMPSRLDRDMATRAIVQAAALLSDAGFAVVIDGAPPFRDAGRLAREVLDNFAEVELVCPSEVCRTRERAVRWNLVPCPGVGRPMAAPDLGLDYEPALAPDLIVFTDVLDPRTAAEEVLSVIDRLERAARERRRPCA